MGSSPWGELSQLMLNDFHAFTGVEIPKIPGIQPMYDNILKWCHFKVMHSLGFAHEHQRPDRNNFVNVYRTKMTSNCFEAFDIIPMDPTKRKSDSKYRVGT